jgi:hypothetical protein
MKREAAQGSASPREADLQHHQVLVSGRMDTSEECGEKKQANQRRPGEAWCSHKKIPKSLSNCSQLLGQDMAQDLGVHGPIRRLDATYPCLRTSVGKSAENWCLGTAQH